MLTLTSSTTLAAQARGVPASVHGEYLTLLEALAGARSRCASFTRRRFLFPGARATLVKDEKHFDRFDRAFAQHFKGIEQAFEALQKDIARGLAASC